MPFNGSGTFNRVHNWVQDAANSIDITDTRMDAEFDGIATGLSNCITKDGQTTITANLPMATFRHTNVGTASARTDYARASQVQDSTLTYLTSVSGTDTITASAPFSPGAYAAGQAFHFVSAGANTGAVTLNVNGLGAKAITKNGTVALVAADIPSGAVCSVVYDGTQFQLAGTLNPLELSDLGTAALLDSGTGTGNVPLVSNIQGQQEEFIPAEAMTPTVSNGCSPLRRAETTAGNPDLEVIDFASDADDHAQFKMALPKRWNAGTVTAQFYWTHTAGTSFGVAWAIQGVSVADGGTMDASYGTAVVTTDTGGTVEDCYITAASSAVTIAGTPADGELQVFRVFRDVSDAGDTLDADARLIGVKLFWTSDALNDA